MRELSEQEVHIWWLRSPFPTSESLRRRLLSILSANERDRWGRFHFERDRIQYLFSHALVRIALSEYVGIEPLSWVFSKNQWGKPFIQSPDEANAFMFSLSHTEGLVACAISRSQLGLDVEHLNRNHTDWSAISHLAMRRRELFHIASVPAQERIRTILRLWTLKESFLKAKGYGLSTDISSLEFDLSQEQPRLSFSDAKRRENGLWQFFEFRPSPEHLMALSVRRALFERVTPLLWDAAPLVFEQAQLRRRNLSPTNE